MKIDHYLHISFQSDKLEFSLIAHRQIQIFPS